MKNKISFKIFNISLCLGLISAIFLSLASFNASCEDLRENILRLHIIANSDSNEDQSLKLKIRDEILNRSEDLFENATDIETAIDIATDKTQEFCDIANEVIRENGYSYSVTAQIGDSYFETREYEDFTLPAGFYKSLIIKVGKAEGKNWWCVIFPEICLPAAAKGDLTDTVNQSSAKIAKENERYVMRFKVVEIYESIKKLIK